MERDERRTEVVRLALVWVVDSRSDSDRLTLRLSPLERTAASCWALWNWTFSHDECILYRSSLI